MWELIEQIDWSDNAYKVALLVVLIVFAYSLYHGARFFFKRSLAIWESGQRQVEKLTDVTERLDQKIELVQQEQAYQNKQLETHSAQIEKQNERIDLLMRSLINVAKR